MSIYTWSKPVEIVLTDLGSSPNTLAAPPEPPDQSASAEYRLSERVPGPFSIDTSPSPHGSRPDPVSRRAVDSPGGVEQRPARWER